MPPKPEIQFKNQRISRNRGNSSNGITDDNNRPTSQNSGKQVKSAVTIKPPRQTKNPMIALTEKNLNKDLMVDSLNNSQSDVPKEMTPLDNQYLQTLNLKIQNAD